jgi:methyltransferase (TIGR00027 family)
MNPAKMSEMAEMIAVTRAEHFNFDAPPKIFEDPLAGDLIINPLLRAAVKSRLCNWVGKRLLFRWARPVIAGILIRARYTEDRLQQAVAAGIRQYLILGAGLDSFAWRRPAWADGVRIIEVDHPATQTAKRQRLEKLGLDCPQHLEFVPVDFERESISDGLARSSFAAERPAFISWMGVVAYLSPEAVSNTLRALAAATAPGSEIVFDYLIPEELWAAEDLRVLAIGKKEVVRRGEPLLSSLDPRQLPVLLQPWGFELVENLSPSELESRYLQGRQDYPRTLSGGYFAHFRLGQRKGQSAE